jgi:hypothetical protein
VSASCLYKFSAIAHVASAADNLVAISVSLSSATFKSLSIFTRVYLFASIVSVRLRTYLTDVNVPASIAATTGTITIFFFTHSNLDNLLFVLLFSLLIKTFKDPINPSIPKIFNFIPNLFNHVFSPQFRRRSCPYLQSSTYLYFLHSTQKFALSNLEYYLSL